MSFLSRHHRRRRAAKITRIRVETTVTQRAKHTEITVRERDAHFCSNWCNELRSERMWNRRLNETGFRKPVACLA